MRYLPRGVSLKQKKWRFIWELIQKFYLGTFLRNKLQTFPVPCLNLNVITFFLLEYFPLYKSSENFDDIFCFKTNYFYSQYTNLLTLQSISQSRSQPNTRVPWAASRSASMRPFLQSKYFQWRIISNCVTWTEQTGPLSLVEVLHYCALIGRELP